MGSWGGEYREGGELGRGTRETFLLLFFYIQSICHQLDPESAISAVDSRKAIKYQMTCTSICLYKKRKKDLFVHDNVIGRRKGFISLLLCTSI